jgi:hypothetical protein
VITVVQGLARLVIPSDTHDFVGRVFDLSIVGMHFESYEQAFQHPDAKYALEVNDRTSLLVRRVESLNHIGELLWPEEPPRIDDLPMSAYEFCNFIQDVFLMRIISILDCCCLLAVEVVELGISPRHANIDRIRKEAGDHPCCETLQKISNVQADLRTERNVRFHRAEEEPLTDDDMTFKTAALYAHRGPGITGKDLLGREIDLKRFYSDAIIGLQKKFDTNVKDLLVVLDDFYDALLVEFNKRFQSKFSAVGSFGQKLATQKAE